VEGERAAGWEAVVVEKEAATAGVGLEEEAMPAVGVAVFRVDMGEDAAGESVVRETPAPQL